MERRGGVFDIDEAMAITLQVLDGLEYAHHAEVDVGLPDGPPCRFTGLVHRDVKPQNIFLSHTGDRPIARIGDYGLGKAFEAAGLIRGTRTGTIMGTPIFMPRQQVINYKYAKPEVDVWAAAASLYYMLTGDSPREFPLGRDPWLVILETDPVPIRQRNPSIPPGLAKVIDEALRDDPAICFTSAADFKLALENVFFEK